MTDREKLLEWCKLYCNNSTLVDEAGFLYVLDNLTAEMERVGVTSESLSDMAQSFGSNDAGMSIKNLLSPYSRLKML